MAKLPPQIVEMATFQGKQPGSKATSVIPADGRRIRKFHLRADEDLNGGIWAVANDLRLILGGRTLRETTPSQLAYLIDLNGFGAFGPNGEDSYLFSYPFTEEWRRSAVEEDALGFGTGNLNALGTLQLEVDVKAGVSDLVLEGKTEIDYPVDESGRPLPVGEIMKYVRTQLPISNAGKYVWSTIPRLDKLHRLHFFSNRIREIKITADNVVLFEMKDVENREMLKRYGFSPVSNVFSVVFDLHQRLSEAVDLSQVADFRVDITTDGTPTPFPVVYELRGPVR
jgi:hypothetical protein